MKRYFLNIQFRGGGAVQKVEGGGGAEAGARDELGGGVGVFDKE